MFITEELENMDKKKTPNTQNFICSEIAKVKYLMYSFLNIDVIMFIICSYHTIV